VISATLMNTLGWTLIHFVWQGILIGLLMGVALFAGSKRCGPSASRYRYSVAIGALALVLLAPLFTFVCLWVGMPEKATQSDSINLALVNLVNTSGNWLNVQDDWLNYLLIAWFAGVFFGSSRLLVSWLSLYMIQRTGIQPTPLWLQQDLRRLRQEYRIFRPVTLLISNVVRAPLTAGWLSLYKSRL